MTLVRVNLNLERLKNTIESALNIEGSLAPAMHDIGRYMVNSTRSNFRLERDPVTQQKWKPLKPETIARKGHSLILRDSYRMIQSTDYRVRGANVTVYNTDEKANWHQNGTRNLPQRRFIGFSNTNRTRVNQIIARQIRTVLGG